jgi:hypothetical protein
VGRRSSKQTLPFFCCFNICIVETLHVNHHHRVLPLQQQGPHQQSTVQDKPANKDRKNKRSRKARKGNPPSTGDCLLLLPLPGKDIQRSSAFFANSHHQ